MGARPAAQRRAGAGGTPRRRRRSRPTPRQRPGSTPSSARRGAARRAELRGTRRGAPRAGRCVAGGLHERRDDRALGVGLGMPLHAQHEAPAAAARSPRAARPGSSCPLTIEPVAEPVDALVVVGLGRVRDLPGGARGERAVARARRRGRRRRRSRARAGAPRGRRARGGAGAACRRSATLISCMPRQIPSTGRSRSIAARVSAISNASRSGTVSTRLRVRLLLVGARGRCRRRRRASARRAARAPARARPRRAASGGSISAIAAGPLHGLDVAERQQRGLLVPDAPPRALERGADADHGPSHAHTP